MTVWYRFSLSDTFSQLGSQFMFRKKSFFDWQTDWSLKCFPSVFFFKLLLGKFQTYAKIERIMIHHVSNSHFSDFSYWQFMIHLLTFIPKCLSPIILTKIHPLVHSISICISEREWLYKNIISLSDSKTKNKELLKLKCSVSVQVSNSLTSFFLLKDAFPW